jgi:type II pantothenate kinase
MEQPAHGGMLGDVVQVGDLLPDGVVGVDAGLTLTKVARGSSDGARLEAFLTHGDRAMDTVRARRIGVTGARDGVVADGAGVTRVQEIDAAARGTLALMAAGGTGAQEPFVLVLLGTGTACALVRDSNVTHLGGTPLGGGSFAGIARRIDATLSYDGMLEGAAQGDRTNADVMIADAYPGGIGRVGPHLTAAHLAKDGGSTDDVLAALLNLHGENIAQIAASRALVAGVRRLVLAGGFAHGNPSLVASITSMASMFGVQVALCPHAGYAGAVGAALAADRAGQQVR